MTAIPRSRRSRSEYRHPALDAERLENRFSNAKWQAVKGADNDDAVAAHDLRPHAIADGWNDLAVDLWRDMLRRVCKPSRGVPLRSQQIAALVKDPAVVGLGALLGLIRHGAGSTLVAEFCKLRRTRGIEVRS